MVSFAIAGVGGRMGRSMSAIVAANADKYQLGAGFEYAGHPAIGQPLSVFLGLPALQGNLLDDAAQAIAGADVLIDFTTPTATVEHVKLCVQMKKAAVVGTTGLTAQQKDFLNDAAKSIPMVFASNFSIAMNLMFDLAGRITGTLGPDYALELIEAHHDKKMDAPSGTAWTLLENMAAASGHDLEKDLRHGRVGMVGPRGRDEIGVSVIRGGDIVGEHTVMYIGQGERLELTHRVQSRDTFAGGAVRAAYWLKGKPAGMYGMKQVLGL